MTQKEAINLILDELLRAKDKHPDYPNDVIHMASIISEESGELVRASNQWEYEFNEKRSGEMYDNLIEEAVQTAAMCVRFLENLPFIKQGG
jgi:hypothetical protein